jgi:hypothetical protein
MFRCVDWYVLNHISKDQMLSPLGSSISGSIAVWRDLGILSRYGQLER